MVTFFSLATSAAMAQQPSPSAVQKQLVNTADQGNNCLKGLNNDGIKSFTSPTAALNTILNSNEPDFKKNSQYGKLSVAEKALLDGFVPTARACNLYLSAFDTIMAMPPGVINVNDIAFVNALQSYDSIRANFESNPALLHFVTVPRIIP